VQHESSQAGSAASERCSESVRESPQRDEGNATQRVYDQAEGEKQMPLTIVQKVVAAGASEQMLVGSQVEFLPVNAQIEIAILAVAAGVLASVSSGSDSLMEEAPVFVAAAGVAPRYPDDFLLSDVAAAGERLQARVRNTTAAAIAVTAAVRTTAI
jgi:hypothetical protein